MREQAFLKTLDRVCEAIYLRPGSNLFRFDVPRSREMSLSTLVYIRVELCGKTC